MLLISELPFDTGEALNQFQARNDEAGAIVTFTGKVRKQGKNGEVEELFLQAYPPLTEQGIEAAIETAQSRWVLSDVEVRHRTGPMAPGETIVFVATASKHRRAAFEAADFLMDYLKTEAIFWKKETTGRGTVWIEPRQQDYRDQLRWQMKEPV